MTSSCNRVYISLVKLDKEVKMKSYVCPRCNKEFSSRQGLWNHKQRCTEQSITAATPAREEPVVRTNNWGIPNMNNSSGAERQSKKNPKIQALVNAIINDSSTEKPLPRERTQVVPQKP